MKLIKTLTVLIGLSVCATFLTACEEGWNWEADPYIASHEYQSIINAEGVEVLCTDPGFDDFTCFTSQNIEELKYNIEQIQGNDRQKARLINLIDKIQKTPR